MRYRVVVSKSEYHPALELVQSRGDLEDLLHDGPVSRVIDDIIVLTGQSNGLVVCDLFSFLLVEIRNDRSSKQSSHGFGLIS